MEQGERRKEARKALGIEPVNKIIKMVMEDLHDDCGEALRGLPGFSMATCDWDSNDGEL